MKKKTTVRVVLHGSHGSRGFRCGRVAKTIFFFFDLHREINIRPGTHSAVLRTPRTEKRRAECTDSEPSEIILLPRLTGGETD